MAQPRTRSVTRARAPGDSHKTALIVGGVVLLAGIGAAIALSGGSSAAASSGGSGSGGGGSSPAKCPASNQPPQLLQYYVTDSGKSVPMTSVDVLHTRLLIQPAQIKTYDWNVVSSNPSVLAKQQSTTGPDPSSPNGTDRIDVWYASGPGTVTLTGQLLPKSGSGPAIGNFTLTVVVTCASTSVGVVNQTVPGTPVPASAAPGHSYSLYVSNPGSTVPVPTPAAAQAVFDAKLGAGAVTVSGASAYGASATRLTVTANKSVTFTAGTILKAVGINVQFIVSKNIVVTVA
jgi:hypothetical protein